MAHEARWKNLSPFPDGILINLYIYLPSSYPYVNNPSINAMDRLSSILLRAVEPVLNGTGSWIFLGARAEAAIREPFRIPEPF